MDIGFIGLGLMGSGMAANFQKAGHRLIVHDIRRAAADNFRLLRDRAGSRKNSSDFVGGPQDRLPLHPFRRASPRQGLRPNLQ